MGGGPERVRPVASYLDPRIEIYAPTETYPYYRIVGYDDRDRRIFNTTGGRSLRTAKATAAEVARRLRRGSRTGGYDPHRVLVYNEAEQWLDASNHRTRENKPWSARHAENMAREWELRISPHIGRRATVSELNDKRLWVRIVNDAQSAGLTPASVQKTGQRDPHLANAVGQVAYEPPRDRPAS